MSAVASKSEDGRVLRAQAQREERRSEILAAAKIIFAQKGYHATSISDIIESAQVARGTFYLYFPSKRTIFQEILSEFVAATRERAKRISLALDAPPPLVQLRANVTAVLAYMVENQATTRIILNSASGVDAEFDAQLADFYNTLTDRLERSLEVGTEMGLVRPLNTRLTAHAVVGSLKELAAQVLSLPIDARPELLEIADTLLDVYLHGVFTVLPPVGNTPKLVTEDKP